MVGKSRVRPRKQMVGHSRVRPRKQMVAKSSGFSRILG
jgi:hypothetical protein